MAERPLFLPSLDRPPPLQITNTIRELADLTSYQYEYSVSGQSQMLAVWMTFSEFKKMDVHVV